MVSSTSDEFLNDLLAFLHQMKGVDTNNYKHAELRRDNLDAHYYEGKMAASNRIINKIETHLKKGGS